MAISVPTLLASTVNDQNAASRTTAAVVPTIGACLVICVYGRETTGGSPAPNFAIAASAGTWSFSEQTVSNGATNRHTASLWTVEVPADYGASVTFTFTPDENCNRWGWALFEFTGSEITVVEAIAGTSTSATPSVILGSAPASTSIVVAMCASISNVGVTPGAGFTEISDTGGSNATTLHTQYRTGSTSTTVAWADCGTTSNLMIAVEIEATTIPTTRKVLARFNNTADTSFDAEIDLGGLSAGMMVAGVATFDPTNKIVGLYLHDGTSDTTALTGTAATQTGDLAIGNSYASSAVVTQTIAGRIGRVKTFDSVQNTTGIATLLGELADTMAPVVADYAVEISGLAATAIDLASVVQDPSLSDWYIASASPQDAGHTVSPISPNAKSFTVNPVGQAGTTTALVTVSNNFGLYPRTASITVTMTKVADEASTAIWPWFTYPLPTGLPTVSVSTRANLDSEIASFNPANGKVIRVAGNFTGSTLTITATGTRAKPLIIEAATQGGATFNFGVALNGQFTALRNLNVPDDGIAIRGKYNSALHCKIAWNGGWATGRAVYFTNGALYGYIFACEVKATPFPTGTAPGSFRRNVIFWDGNGVAGQPRWCLASHCYATEAPARPVPTTYSSASVAAIIMGDDVSIAHIPNDNIAYRVLLKNAKGGHGQFETKMSRSHFIECWLVDSPSVNGGGASNINNRQGHGNDFIRCGIRNAGGFEIHGSAIRLIRPKVTSGSTIRSCAGTGAYYGNLTGSASTFGPADEVRIVNPTGNVVAGEDYNAGSGNAASRPIPARNTRVQGASTNLAIDFAIGTDAAYASGDTSPAAVELLPAQVGLSAPQADDLSGLPNEMWQFSGWLDYTRNWQVYKTTGNGSSVVQTDVGFEIKAGTGTATAGTIYAFSRYTVPYDNLQLDFDFTRTDGGGGGPNGEAFLVYFGARGKGTTLTPTDLSTLDYSAFRVIEDEMSGYRMSFGQDSGASNDDQMRLRIFRADGTAGEQIISTSGNVFPFTQGVRYRVHMMKYRDTISIHVTNTAARTFQSVTATDTRVDELTGGGHIGIRCMPGRMGRIESIKVSRF